MGRLVADMPTDNASPWEDKEKLYTEYVDNELSMAQIAEKLNTTKSTIRYWLKKHDIQRRDTQEAMQARFSLSIKTRNDGYERLQHQYKNDKYEILHHRLVAVAEYGISAVSDMSVHHENGIEWDNRPENLTVLSDSDHRVEHLGYDERPWTDPDVLQELYVNKSMSQKEIGEKFGISQSAVYKWLKRHDITTRDAGPRSQTGPWQDKQRLEEVYCKKDMTRKEIAEMWDTSYGIIHYWIQKYSLKST